MFKGWIDIGFVDGFVILLGTVALAIPVYRWWRGQLPIRDAMALAGRSVGPAASLAAFIVLMLASVSDFARDALNAANRFTFFLGGVYGSLWSVRELLDVQGPPSASNPPSAAASGQTGPVAD